MSTKALLTGAAASNIAGVQPDRSHTLFASTNRTAVLDESGIKELGRGQAHVKR